MIRLYCAMRPKPVSHNVGNAVSGLWVLTISEGSLNAKAGVWRLTRPPGAPAVAAASGAAPVQRAATAGAASATRRRRRCSCARRRGAGGPSLSTPSRPASMVKITVRVGGLARVRQDSRGANIRANIVQGEIYDRTTLIDSWRLKWDNSSFHWAEDQPNAKQ